MRVFSIFLGLFAICSLGPSIGKATAADQARSGTKGPFYSQSENELRARKLARGTANIMLAVAEIPNQAFQEAYKTTPITGTVVGIGKGLYKGLKRVVIGAWEIATFYAPMNNYYQPYIEPEVVFMEYIH